MNYELENKALDTLDEAYAKYGEVFAGHWYFNTERDFYVDMSRPPKSPQLCKEIAAIKKAFNQPDFRLHLTF